MQVVNSEAFPDISLAISSPFRILAKLEKILEAKIGYSLITFIKILSKNKSIALWIWVLIFFLFFIWLIIWNACFWIKVKAYPEEGLTAPPLVPILKISLDTQEI